MPFHLDDFDARGGAVSAREWRRRLSAGESMFGLWLAAGSPVVAELLGDSGADWIIIDAEHSPQTLPGIADQLRALEASQVFPVVRAASNDPGEIGRLLDIGARGVMVPMIQTPGDVTEVLAAVRYPPAGRRGVGGGFARATRWNAIEDYLGHEREAHSVILQIESVVAVDAIDDILAVGGVEAVFVGPADLAASAGLLGQPRHDAVRALVEQVILAARRRDVAVGVNAFDPRDVVHYHRLGARLFGIGADVTLLRQGAAEAVARIRGDLGEAPR
jgi:4-hydroxy-2-oxoheptanedioate aldolase